MEAAGFVVVADCKDATDTSFYNGYVVRKEYMNEHYDETLLFLKAVYKAAEELQNNTVRNEFAYKYYTDNDKPASMEDVRYETNVRPFFTAETVAQNPPLGSTLLNVAEFFYAKGAIDETGLETAAAAIDVQPINEALNLNITSAKLE
jgi:ABC-type nitrate/sulfonate/bicarbonate transport system substrate-binding protein